jgi:hypothetical protein
MGQPARIRGAWKACWASSNNRWNDSKRLPRPGLVCHRIFRVPLRAWNLKSSVVRTRASDEGPVIMEFQLGASEATIFSMRGSPRSGSQ